nr:unnamed protein product [Spirometra erinaceieuropaei]
MSFSRPATLLAVADSRITGEVVISTPPSNPSSLGFHARLGPAVEATLSKETSRGSLASLTRCSLAFEDLFEFATTTNLRGYQLKLRTQRARLDVRKFSFSV